MGEVDTTTDAVLGGTLMLRQPRRGHRAGHDAILLAASTRARPGDRVVEFGAGVGTAGLALARRVKGIDLTLIEIDPFLATLARDNAAANDVRANVHTLDVGADAAAFTTVGLAPDLADVVLMNPPFNDIARQRPPTDAAKKLAHMASDATLDVWVGAARRVLKSGGVLTLIWRADGLAGVLAALDSGFGSVAILPVYANPGSSAIRILVRVTKGGRAPLALIPALVLNDVAGRPTDTTNALLTGRSVLPLAER